MDNLRTFGAQLRKLRKNAGLTLRELAERVNVSFTYLSKIENGILPPPSKKSPGDTRPVYSYQTGAGSCHDIAGITVESRCASDSGYGRKVGSAPIHHHAGNNRIAPIPR